MNKSVLISIKPKWCKLIASGQKTIEVRKTKPNIETPFICYIYETKYNGKGRGKVIGEFVCDYIESFECSTEEYSKLAESGSCLSMDEILSYCGGQTLYGWHISQLKLYNELKELYKFYVQDTKAIKNCEYRSILNKDFADENGAIFEKGSYVCKKYEDIIHCNNCIPKQLLRPPQSWIYVEIRRKYEIELKHKLTCSTCPAMCTFRHSKHWLKYCWYTKKEIPEKEQYSKRPKWCPYKETI